MVVEVLLVGLVKSVLLAWWRIWRGEQHSVMIVVVVREERGGGSSDLQSMVFLVVVGMVARGRAWC